MGIITYKKYPLRTKPKCRSKEVLQIHIPAMLPL